MTNERVLTKEEQEEKDAVSNDLRTSIAVGCWYNRQGPKGIAKELWGKSAKDVRYGITKIEELIATPEYIEFVERAVLKGDANSIRSFVKNVKKNSYDGPETLAKRMLITVEQATELYTKMEEIAK